MGFEPEVGSSRMTGSRHNPLSSHTKSVPNIERVEKRKEHSLDGTIY